MALNANAIIDKTEIKLYLKEASTAEDTLFETIINNVSSMFEVYCDNIFIIQALTEDYDGNGTEMLMLRHWPITVLTKVVYEYDGEQAVSNFKYNAATGVLMSTYAAFPEGFQNVEIQYSAGLAVAKADLPPDLKQAALKQVEFFYKRDAADFSDTFAEGMIVKAPADLFSPIVRGLLAPYRNIRTG